MAVSNKELDIPVEVLFKYLCRDFRKAQTKIAELEGRIKDLKAQVNYSKNNLPDICKLQEKIRHQKKVIKELEIKLSTQKRFIGNDS